MGGALSSAFVAAGGIADFVPDDLERALSDAWEAGRAAWPTVRLSAETFVAHLGALSRAGGALPSPQYSADLYLACACAHSIPGAVEAFEKAFAAALLRSASRVNAPNADEIVQMVRERLLVRTPERAPKIAEYGGRAKLSSWLAAVCAREALNSRRRKDDQSHESLSAVVASSPMPEPEIAILRARHAEDFRQAIRVGLSRLESKDRALLRMALVVGLSSERIAEVYKVSRATAKRWLAAARGALQEETRKELATRLHLTPSELESLAAVIRSEIQLSVGALLAETNA